MSSRPKAWYSERDCPIYTRGASSFFCNPLYFFAHAMWVKWWYLANFQPFQSSFCTAFSLSRWFSFENKSVNASKIANYVRKGWKLMTCIWIVHLNAKEVRSCTKLLKYWIAGVTYDFSSETLILRKRLSSLYTSASSFCRNPLYFFAHAMRVKWWYLAKFQPFESSFSGAFHFHGDLALKTNLQIYRK